MRSRLLLPALAAVICSACLEPLDPPDGRLGLILVETYGPDDPNYVIAPTGIFYGRTSNQFTVFPTDSCVLSFYSSTPPSSGFITTLHAGTELGMSVSGQLETMLPETQGSFVTYYTQTISGISFTPGDTITFTVPGVEGGFPASSIQARTAEPFTHSEIPIPNQGDPIEVTWDAAPQPGAIMNFSLRYVVGPGNTPNEQVFCGFADDGTGTIPGHLLNGWRTSAGEEREVLATRLRFNQVAVDGRTALVVVSTFKRPLGSISAP